MTIPDNKVLTGRLVLPEGVHPGGLWIRDGKIAAILAPDAVENIRSRENNNQTFEIVDHGDAYLMPGLIEVHGHLREPGLTQIDFSSRLRKCSRQT